MEGLELIKKLPVLEKREWTYLEKIGISHRETVIAEILRYYFDPNEKHGLGDTFIHALLKTEPKYLDNKEKKIGCGHNTIQDSYYNDILNLSKINFVKETTTANTEVITFNNNRIDILINSNELVIVIEFKINHHLDNPLDDYVNFTNCKALDKKRCNKYKNKKKYFVVLTPYWKTPVGKARKNKDFVQITLSNFINKVICLIGDFWDDKKNTHQYYIYRDFINTIKNRQIEVKLVKDYSKLINTQNKIDFIEKLYYENNLESEITKGLIIIKNNFEKKIRELLKRNKEYHLLNATKNKLQSTVVRKINNNIEYKVRLSFNGWYFEKWKKNDKGEWKESEKERIGDFFTTIDNLLEKING